MADIETIDSELRLAVALRRPARERGGPLPSPFDPDDLRRHAEGAAAASTEAAALHDHAMTLGYNVGVGIASAAADRRIHVGPLGKEPEVWFQSLARRSAIRDRRHF